VGGIYLLEQRGDVAYALLLRRFPDGDGGAPQHERQQLRVSRHVPGQWLVGLVLGCGRAAAPATRRKAYHWALGALWLLQLAGLRVFWRGRRLFANW